MANLRVNLFKRVRVNGTLRYCPVVYRNNARIKPDIVRVDGHEERHPEGSYYISWYEGTKVKRIAVGRDANNAVLRQQDKESELAKRTNGNGNTPAIEEVSDTNSSDPTLTEAIAKYLAEVKILQKPKTFAAYAKALDYFVTFMARQSWLGADIRLSQINRSHLIRFQEFLKDERALSPRTVFNKFENLLSFLGNQGAVMLRPNKKGKMTVAGISSDDKPKKHEALPEVYEREEIDQLFAACTEDEKLWFQFFLMTGMREQEVMYCYWKDIDLAHAFVKVTHKPDRNWTPKTNREREIPIPQTLVEALRTYKEKRDKTCNIVFPTAGCNPKLDFLDGLKRAAKRAELNSDNFWLHKFRATFATWHLWAGVDIRTVQDWMGHSPKDTESIMRYVRPNRGQAVQEKVNNTFGGAQ